MGFAEDVPTLLGQPPAETSLKSTEAARGEANTRAHRGDAAYDGDPRGDQGPAAALAAYREALEIDPACKAAYAGIAKVVIARASGDRGALEAALRFVSAGVKNAPNDSELIDTARRLRELIPAKTTESHAARSPLRKSSVLHKSDRNCEYCGSPIPYGATTCRSCQMSGELARPGAPARGGGGGSKLGLVILIIIALGVAVAAVVVHQLHQH